MVSSVKKTKSSNGRKESERSEPRSSIDETFDSDTSSQHDEEPVYGDPEIFFFGCELKEDSKEYTWDYSDYKNHSQSSAEESMVDLEDHDAMKHILHLRQVTLGIGAKQGERNIIAVETEDEKEEIVSFPVASLSIGNQEMARIKLDFKGSVPVTLKLISGSGPVAITGMIERILEYQLDDLDELNMEQENIAALKEDAEKSAESAPSAEEEDEDEDEEEEEDESEDEEMEEEEMEEEKTKVKKRKVDGNYVKKVKSPGHKISKKKIKAKQIMAKQSRKMST